MPKPETPLADVVPLFSFERREDDALMALARAGERGAFDALVARHQRAVLRIAAKYLGDVAAARDACQSAFLEVYRDRERYRPGGRFPYYLRRVVLNQCHMYARRLRLVARLPTDVPSSPILPDEQILAEERRRLVEAEVGRLSSKLRDVVVLRYAGDHSIDEIAQILELPVGTVKSRLFAALRALGKALEVKP